MTNEELRRTRKGKPFTQAQLGHAIGYSRFAISKWEDGIHPIPDEVAAKVIEVCIGVPMAKPKNAKLTADTIKYYGEMRRDGISHASIMKRWHEANFVPSPEAQAQILIEWPELKELSNG